MKKKVFIAYLLICALALTACGGKENNPSDTTDSGNIETETQADDVVEENSKNKALAGLYPEGNELAEIPLGTYGEATKNDYCKVKVPLNYWSGAIANLSSVDEEGFEMSSGTDLVSDALDAGLLEQDHSITYLSLTNGYLVEDSTELNIRLYQAEQGTYEDFKKIFPEITEIGTSENPAFYAEETRSYAAGEMAICYAVNPDITLVIYYSGPLYDELGIDAIAENLYNIIEVI